MITNGIGILLYRHIQLRIPMPIGITRPLLHEFNIKCTIALNINPTATAAIPYKIDLIVYNPLYFFQ